MKTIALLKCKRKSSQLWTMQKLLRTQHHELKKTDNQTLSIKVKSSYAIIK